LKPAKDYFDAVALTKRHSGQYSKADPNQKQKLGKLKSTWSKTEIRICFPISTFRISAFSFSRAHFVPVNSQAHFCLARDLLIANCLF
jgi:hypothetical protein